MALNTVSSNGRRTVTTEANDIDFSSGTTGEATVTVPGLKHVESPADVVVQAYGSGDSDSAAGFVARATGVGTDASGTLQVTVRAYYSAGSTAAMADADVADVDHVVIRATGV